MKIVFNIFGIALVALLSACGGNDTCDEPQRYQESRQSQKIAVPEDLDQPNLQLEMTIPDVSAQETQRTRTGCLDVPPNIRSGS